MKMIEMWWLRIKRKDGKRKKDLPCITLQNSYSVILLCIYLSNILYRPLHYNLTTPISSPHLSSSLHFDLPLVSCFVTSVTLISLSCSLFLFVVKEWHTHHFISTFYFYFLVTFNHQVLWPKQGVNDERRDGAFSHTG